MKLVLAGVVVASSLVGGGCGSVEDRLPPGTREDVLVIKSIPNRDLDLLFVIDDSATMLDKQAAVRAAFPVFIGELQALSGGIPNLHIGVVSSDLGTTGRGSPTPGAPIGQPGLGGCIGAGKAGNLLANGAPILDGGTYLSDVAQGAGRMRNYTGPLDEAFGQMASLGGGGCGFEQHLHAMRRALDNNPMNGGFLRDGANLAVIIVADEDDCSVLDSQLFAPETAALGPLQSFRCFKFGVQCDPDQPETLGAKAGCRPRAGAPIVEDVAAFRTFLASVKPDRRQLMFGALAGTTDTVEVESNPNPNGGPNLLALKHTCDYESASGRSVADPAIRLRAMTEGFEGLARFESVCRADVAPPMAALGRTARKLVGDPCLERDIADADPVAAGLQPSCLVVDEVSTVETELRACSDPGTGSCWELVPDARCVDTTQHLKLSVTRAEAADPAAYTTVRCEI